MWKKFYLSLCLLILLANAVNAQSGPQAPVGLWDCVVNSNVVSITLRMQTMPNRTLVGQGKIIYVQTGYVYNVQGNGDWSALPPDPGSNQWLFKFRMFPQNHAIFTWFAGPTSDFNYLANTFHNPQTGSTVQTNCQRVG